MGRGLDEEKTRGRARSRAVLRVQQQRAADGRWSCGAHRSHSCSLCSLYPSSVSVPLAWRILQLHEPRREYKPEPFLRGGPTLACTDAVLTFTRAQETRSFSIHNRASGCRSKWSLDRLRAVARARTRRSVSLALLSSMVNVGYRRWRLCSRCRVASLFAFVPPCTLAVRLSRVRGKAPKVARCLVIATVTPLPAIARPRFFGGNVSSKMGRAIFSNSVRFVLILSTSRDERSRLAFVFCARVS